MTSTHIFAAAVFAFSASAFAQTTQAPGAPGTQSTQQQAQPAAAEPHQHRYVYIGRDRTKVHLDRPAERSDRAARAMGSSGAPSASPAAPLTRGEDLKGGPN